MLLDELKARMTKWELNAIVASSQRIAGDLVNAAVVIASDELFVDGLLELIRKAALQTDCVLVASKAER